MQLAHVFIPTSIHEHRVTYLHCAIFAGSVRLILHLQRLSLNGTVESRDLINVTITVPPRWAIDLFNATNTGKGYLNVRYFSHYSPDFCGGPVPLAIEVHVVKTPSLHHRSGRPSQGTLKPNQLGSQLAHVMPCIVSIICLRPTNCRSIIRTMVRVSFLLHSVQEAVRRTL